MRESSGTIKSRFVPAIQFPAGRLAPGAYVYAIRLVATLNDQRASLFVSKPFKVGTTKAKKKGKHPKRKRRR